MRNGRGPRSPKNGKPLREFVYSGDVAEAAIYAAKNHQETSRYGSVTITEDSKISAFKEKEEDAGNGFINSGIYLFKKTFILKEAYRKMPVSLERDIFPENIDIIYAFQSDSAFIDIGTPESYKIAKTFFKTVGIHGLTNGKKATKSTKMKA